jgi:ribosome maturation factor RimP
MNLFYNIIFKFSAKVSGQMPTLFFEGEGAYLQELKIQLEKIITEAAAAAGYELVEWIYIPGGRGIVRVFIDKADGVTIEDCGRFSEYLGSILDIEDPIPSSYTLEVSSPGVDRPLRSEKDYQMAKSKWVIIYTREPVNGKREIAGNLHDVQEDCIIVDDDGDLQSIRKELILKAHLDTPLFNKR